MDESNAGFSLRRYQLDSFRAFESKINAKPQQTKDWWGMPPISEQRKANSSQFTVFGTKPLIPNCHRTFKKKVVWNRRLKKKGIICPKKESYTHLTPFLLLHQWPIEHWRTDANEWRQKKSEEMATAIGGLYRQGAAMGKGRSTVRWIFLRR